MNLCPSRCFSQFLPDLVHQQCQNMLLWKTPLQRKRHVWRPNKKGNWKPKKKSTPLSENEHVASLKNDPFKKKGLSSNQHFSGNMLVFGGIHPRKQTWQWKNNHLKMYCISYQNDIVMLVFGGVTFRTGRLHIILHLQPFQLKERQKAPKGNGMSC